ncbi:NAD(P)H:quinone oxidoreductase [Alkalicoccus chagannorensis]|uniref:NAD(P)H:quinone oxidoreductase n=1 Tax=Alkalicoccus chagannorensis TaxID=427072 RepID=UPI0003FC7D4C|nr:NAD(P)H:quinone oxidoreductase [Alkalicoccus chagannorensis]
MTKVLIPYYSTFGHIYTMVKAAAEGAAQVDGVEVKIVRIEEFDAVKAAMSGQDAYDQAQEMQKDVPTATHEDLKWADGILWGIPTRYGTMPAQMKQFLDSAGSLWMNGELEGKVTGVVTSTGSIHGGQETTALTTFVPLMHFGMIYVGLPYGENPEQLTTDGIGGSPYAASTVAGPDGSSQPDERDLTMTRRLGKRIAETAKKLHG